MARPRTFDEDDVLDRALEAFWERGYDGTSMADLIEATGIQKGSLYNAFGDKEQLYFRALDRYHEAIEARIEAVFLDAPGAAGIRAWLEALLEMCRGTDGKRGCFAANAIAERASRDAHVRKVVRKHERRLRGFIEGALAAGQADGTIPASESAQDLADVLWTFATGLRLAARSGEPVRGLETRIETIRSLVLGSDG